MNNEPAAIAIHDQPGGFSDRWIEYCRQHTVPHRLVNCRDTAIIDRLSGVKGLLWNWQHDSPEDQLCARQVIEAVERMGVQVFPSTADCWHYDDKVAQKYLLEAVGAPLVPSYVFYDKTEALRWIGGTSFPKVFKLRAGAGSQNVLLVKSRQQARRLCATMFGKGIRAASGGYFGDVRRKVRRTRDFRHVLEKAGRMLASLRSIRHMRQFLPVQKGYIYFQDFLAGNSGDTRVTVIGNRAFAFRRMNRPGDFRASGSGEIIYDPGNLDQRCLRAALDTTRALGAHCIAFDFLFDANNDAKIGEISYTFAASAVYDCPGYWDQELRWHEGHFWPQDLIIEDFLNRRP